MSTAVAVQPWPQATPLARTGSFLLVAGAAAWAIVSLAERNAAIFAAAFLPMLAALLLARLVERRDPVILPLFAIAYVVRTMSAIAAYEWGKGQAYWVGGVGSDALAYYETSFLDAGEVLFGLFSFKGFAAYNSFMTKAALALDQASYLVNLQGPIVAGTLLALLVYGVARQLTDDRSATAIGVVMALHPAMIAISSVLLRDTIVGLVGWTVLYAALRALRAPGTLRTLLALGAGAAALYLLSFLRLQSMVMFFGFALVLVWFTSRADGERSRLTPGMRRILLLGTVVMAAGLAVVVVASSASMGIGGDYIQYVLEYRAENATQGSLGASFGSGNPAVATVMYTVLALLAPFPFYAWSAEMLGHPTGPLDYLMGFGGVVNQFLCAFFIIGVFTAVRRRMAWVLALVACVVGFIVLTILGGGDTIRYVASHVYGFFLVVAFIGVRAIPPGRGAVVGLWIAGIVALYTVYEALKLGAGRGLLLGGGIAVLLHVGAFMLRAWQLSAPPREAPGAEPLRVAATAE